MTEVTIKIPEKLRKEAEKIGVDWTLFMKRIIRNLEKEKELIDCSVKLQRTSRNGRYKELKKAGLV